VRRSVVTTTEPPGSDLARQHSYDHEMNHEQPRHLTDSDDMRREQEHDQHQSANCGPVTTLGDPPEASRLCDRFAPGGPSRGTIERRPSIFVIHRDAPFPCR
jgi:hypothetical protein